MNRSAVFYTTPFFPAGILDIRLCGLFGAMPHWLPMNCQMKSNR